MLSLSQRMEVELEVSCCSQNLCVCSTGNCWAPLAPPQLLLQQVPKGSSATAIEPGCPKHCSAAMPREVRVVYRSLEKFLVSGALVFCQVLAISLRAWLAGGERRRGSPETGCRTGRKLTGLGYAGAADDIICFCSAGRQREKAAILC